MKIQLISLALSLLFLCFLLVQIYRRRLKEAYALLWLLTGLGVVILAAFPPLLIFLSDLVGIYYPPATIFLFAIMLLFLIVLQYSMVISKQNEDIRALSQKLALLEEEVRNKHDR